MCVAVPQTRQVTPTFHLPSRTALLVFYRVRERAIVAATTVAGMAENLMPLFLTRPLLRDRARCRQGLSCRTRRSVVFLCPFVAACHAAPMDKEDGQACDKRGTQEACAPHVTAAGTVRLLGHPEMKICPETNTFSSVM